VYVLFKNYSNLSLKSCGVYLYNSELTLSYPGLLKFYFNFKVFSNSSGDITVSL